MLTFSTLGQAGSNHHFVLQQYLAAHGIEEVSRIQLFDDFHAGARALIAGEADYLLQCAVHPAAAEITGTYRTGMAVVDAFISPSRPMALVRATHSEEGAGKVGVQPATQTYADLSAWPDVVHEHGARSPGGLERRTLWRGRRFRGLCAEARRSLRGDRAYRHRLRCMDRVRARSRGPGQGGRLEGQPDRKTVPGSDRTGVELGKSLKAILRSGGEGDQCRSDDLCGAAPR